MANTWTAYASGVAFAAGKNMLAILNEGSRVLRIRRIILLNIQTTAVTGVLCVGAIRRYTAAALSAPTAVTPVTHDTTNSTLDTITIGTGGTISGSGPDTLRQYIWSSDEPGAGSGTVDELEMLPAFGVIFDAGYADEDVQPLVVRTNELVSVYNISGAAGVVDIIVEFTDEAE